MTKAIIRQAQIDGAVHFLSRHAVQRDTMHIVVSGV
jgi:hypothetical protein